MEYEEVNKPLLGKHILLEIQTKDLECLTDVKFIEEALKNAARKANATILNSFFHKFGGHGGVTGVLALAESHLSIHTWPEFCCAAIDVFMCGESNPDLACDELIKIFKSIQFNKKLIERRFGV